LAYRSASEYKTYYTHIEVDTFCILTPCSFSVRYRRFGRPSCFLNYMASQPRTPRHESSHKFTTILIPCSVKLHYPLFNHNKTSASRSSTSAHPRLCRKLSYTSMRRISLTEISEPVSFPGDRYNSFTYASFKSSE